MTPNLFQKDDVLTETRGRGVVDAAKAALVRVICERDCGHA